MPGGVRHARQSPGSFHQRLSGSMITIREAVPSDASAIADFQVLMAWDTERVRLDTDIVAKGVQSVFADRHKGAYYVAEIDGAPVASALTTYEWSDWRNGTVLWVHSVFVKEKFRRRGVFRALYSHIRALVESNPQLKGIRLYVDKTNIPAQAVYEAIGMDGHHYRLFEWMKER
jgi:ribosomal protein S18 acetylase RimI-like enzyme